MDLSGNSEAATVTVTVNNSIYACFNASPPPAPAPTTPSGSSVDGEIEGIVFNKDLEASTVTIATEDGNETIVITSETLFKGSISENLTEVVVGHMVQAMFFRSTMEAVQIETDFVQ